MLKKKGHATPVGLDSMDEKNDCNSKTKDSRSNHNNSHDVSEDTSQSGGEPSFEGSSRSPKKGKRVLPCPSSEPRSSKRLRLQYQPFQSPSLHIPQIKPSKPSEEKQVVYMKGEFLALRNESGSFFICQAAQNVYKSSHKFRIRWLSKSESGSDVYSRDFYDCTDFECVLTNIQMERLDKNLFRLPKEEAIRTEGILKKAISLENGANDLESDYSENPVVEKMKNEDDSVREPTKICISVRRGSVGHSRVSSGRQPRYNADRHQPVTRAEKAKPKNVILTPKFKGKVNKGNKVKVKQKNSSAGNEVRSRSRKKTSSTLEKEKKTFLKFSVITKDPMFESNNIVPFISTMANSKLLIRAVLMNDLKYLQNILKESGRLCWIGVCRSVDQRMDALAYAVLQENHDAIELLMTERQHSNKTSRLPERLLLHHSVGRSNFKVLGSCVKEMSLSRGAREGNSALMKDNHEELTDQDYISLALEHGVSKDTLDFFCSHPSKGKQSLKQLAISNLFRAVRHGHRKLACGLIEDAMKTDGHGFNMLHKEVLSFDRHDLSHFRPDAIRKGSFGNCGVTPLHCAAINPVAKYLNQLVEMDSEFNVGDAHLRKPIHYAAACDGPCPLELLLSIGVKTDEVDVDGCTALHVAAETGRVHNVELLLRKAKSDKRTGEETKISRDYGTGGINRPNGASYTALHLACMAGHLDVVKALLKYGADVKKPAGVSKSKVTPLMLACQNGHLEIAKYLLLNGAKLESKDKLKRTCVTHAVVNGHAHVLCYLLKSGANPNDTDSSGNSLLHYAVAYGWWFCVKLLLDVGASLNIVNDWKVTPLGIAFLKGHIGLAELLLNYPNIDVDFRDDNGMSVLMLAVCSPLVPELVKLIGFLITNKKAKCSVADLHGNTALHWLACNSIHLKGDAVCEDALQTSLKIAKLLLENDCDPSARNYHGQTVLTLAIQEGNNELVKLLLSDGWQVTAEVDDTGENLLHALVEHSWETNLASLLQIIKDSPGKKARMPLSEDALEVNLKHPTVPLLEDLTGILRVGDVICVRGTLSAPFEQFSTSLLQGSRPEKDDAAVTVVVRMSPAGLVLSCGNRTNGEVKKDEKDLAFPTMPCMAEDADGRSSFDLSFVYHEDHFQILAGGTSVADFPTDVSPKQVTHLHVTEGVSLTSVHVERGTITKAVLPSVSLPSDVLREMAQTYSYDGFTPLLLACSKYHFTTERRQQELLRHMIKTLIEEAESEIHSLVKKRSDNKSRKIDGFSALHFLASTKEFPVIEDGIRNLVPGLSLLLNYKPPINIQDHRGRTPLITAILNRHPAAAEALINAGAAINMCSGDMDEDGRASPLILAAKLGLVSVIKLLLKHGANVQVADEKNHSTALHYAVTMKSLTDALEVVRCLIEAGININSANQDGRTPLHLAVNANNGSTDDMIEIEDLLIERGADQLARDSLGRLPLHYAFVKIGRPADSSKIDPIEVVTLLTGSMKGNMDVPDHYGQTPLHCAAFRGATISCMHLAQSVGNLNAKDKNGNTALSLAVLGSHDSCAIMLLQKGASVQVDVITPPLECHTRERVKRQCWQWKPVAQIPIQPKRTPLLQEVVQKDWQGVMYMMLGQLEASGANYFPAIEAALKTGKFKLALNLIARTKNWDKCNMCNRLEQNLLHVLACMAKSFDAPQLQVKVAQVLINRGVSLASRDTNGNTPLLYAAMNRNYVLCEFFTDQLGINAVIKMYPNKCGCSPVSALFWNLSLFQWQSPKLKDIRAWCQRLCTHGSTCNDLVAYPYLDSCPGESWAYVTKNAELQTGETTCRITPLIFAVCLQDYDLVAFLLQQGADINFPDEHGRTPLMHAVHKNDIGMVRLLLNPTYCYKSDMWSLMQKRHLSKLMSYKSSDVTQPGQKVWAPVRDGSGSLAIKHATSSTKEENWQQAKHSSIANEKPVNGPTAKNKLQQGILPDGGANCESVPEKDIEDADEAQDADDEMQLDVKPGVVSKVCPISLTQTDRHGWTVIHHLIRPVSCGTYDNAEILYLLAEAGAPLNISNTAGFSPLQMAVQSRAYRLATALRNLLGTSLQEAPFGSVVDLAVKDGINWDRDPWDYKNDSEKVLERVESEAMEEGEDENIVLPDVHSGMEEMGEVVIDSEQNIPFDVFMTKVDVNGGLSGCYSFFKIQVISQQGKNLFVLFTRWGKLGTEGEYRQTPHSSVEEATREFCRVFKLKSGNNWQDVKNFRPVTRKYRLVEALRRGRRKLRDIPLTLVADVPSKMPHPLQKLMAELTDVPMLQEACQDIGIDTSVMPFGRLCEAALQRGRQILKELKNVITEKIKLHVDLKSKDTVIELAEKIIDLSSEYYQVVPQPGYVYEKVRPLENLKDIQKGLDDLEYMFDLKLISKILLGAQLREKEVNPLDYVYRAMDCHISAMQEEDMESQYILQYFHNTSLSQSPIVKRIYKVSRKEEVLRSQTNNHENRWLLWHGVSVANLISILTRGLNSLRFTDSFEMSQRMCKYSSKRTASTQYVLLCEVSLGELAQDHDSLQAGQEEGDAEKQYVKLMGTYFPDPVCNLILSTGVTIPLGSLTCKYNNEGMTVLAQSDYNEYVVSSREQVSIRYIVCYHHEHSERHHKANKVPTHS